MGEWTDGQVASYADRQVGKGTGTGVKGQMDVENNRQGVVPEGRTSSLLPHETQQGHGPSCLMGVQPMLCLPLQSQGHLPGSQRQAWAAGVGGVGCGAGV